MTPRTEYQREYRKRPEQIAKLREYAASPAGKATAHRAYMKRRGILSRLHAKPDTENLGMPWYCRHDYNRLRANCQRGEYFQRQRDAAVGLVVDHDLAFEAMDGGCDRRRTTFAMIQEMPGRMEAREWLLSLIRELDPRYALVVVLRSGLGDGHEYTLLETGRILRVSRERVRQIQAKAMRKLQFLAKEVDHAFEKAED